MTSDQKIIKKTMQECFEVITRNSTIEPGRMDINLAIETGIHLIGNVHFSAIAEGKGLSKEARLHILLKLQEVLELELLPDANTEKTVGVAHF